MNQLIEKHNLKCNTIVVATLFSYDEKLARGKHNVLITGVYNYYKGIIFARGEVDNLEVVLVIENDELVIDYVCSERNAIDYIVDKHDELFETH